MARGMIRFYGHGAVSQPVGFTSQVIFRFSNGFYDLDAVSVTPNILSKLMRRFPYHNLDAQGQPTGEKMLNGMPFNGETGGVKIIINEAAMRPNQKDLHRHEDNQQDKPVPIPQPSPMQEIEATPPAEEPAPVGDDVLTSASVKAARTRKEIVGLAKKAGVSIEKWDKTDDIKTKILKQLEE